MMFKNFLNSLPDTSNLDVLRMDSKLLRLGSRLLSKSVCTLMNLCTHNGTFSTELKKARVTPVYKKKALKWNVATIDQYHVYPT